MSCEEPIFSISPSICGKVAAVQLINGSVLKFSVDDDVFELLPWTSPECQDVVQFPTVCSQLRVSHCGSAVNRHRIFAISSRNRLYCDNVEVATGIK